MNTLTDKTYQDGLKSIYNSSPKEGPKRYYSVREAEFWLGYGFISLGGEGVSWEIING